MSVEYEYNAACVRAQSSVNPASRVIIGYELLRRPKGTGYGGWEVMARTQDRGAAVRWAARSGYRFSGR